MFVFIAMTDASVFSLNMFTHSHTQFNVNTKKPINIFIVYDFQENTNVDSVAVLPSVFCQMRIGLRFVFWHTSKCAGFHVCYTSHRRTMQHIWITICLYTFCTPTISDIFSEKHWPVDASMHKYNYKRITFLIFKCVVVHFFNYR